MLLPFQNLERLLVQQAVVSLLIFPTSLAD
jgi:hypothetical protein